MTIEELFDKYNIEYTVIKKEQKIQLLKVNDYNLLIWINDNNLFKMHRKWFEQLENNCEKYALLLVDKSVKKNYYIKCKNKNNWVSQGFYNCNKNEIYLGKQVMNYEKSLAYIISDIKG